MNGSNQVVEVWQVLDESNRISSKVAAWRGVDAPFMGEVISVADPDVQSGTPRSFQVRWREWGVAMPRMDAGDVAVLVCCYCTLLDLAPATSVPDVLAEAGVPDAGGTEDAAR